MPLILSFSSLFIALIIGGNIGATDLEHRLDLFWQSRPIDPARYFYKRYASGLILTLLLFVIPALLFAVIAGLLQYLYPDAYMRRFYVLGEQIRWFPEVYFWSRVFEVPRQVESEAFWALPQLCLTYGIAAFSAAFLRQRLLAMLLAGLLFFILPLGTLAASVCNDLVTINASYYNADIPLSDHLNVFLLLSLLLLLPLSLLLAKLASLPFLHDWKSRLEHFLALRRHTFHGPPVKLNSRATA